MLFVDLRDPLGPGQTLFRIFAVLESQAVDPHQLLPGTAPDVDRLQQAGGRHARLGIFQQVLQDLDAGRVIRLALQDLAQILEGALAVGQLDALDLRQSETQFDVLVSAEVPFQPTFDQVHQIVPTAQLDIESVQRRHRLGVARQQRPNPLPGCNRLVLSGQTNRQAARFAPQGHLDTGNVGQIRPSQDDFVERGQIVLLAVDSFQSSQRRVVIRAPLGDAAEVIDGQGQVAQGQGVLGHGTLHPQSGFLGQDIGLNRAIEIDDLDHIFDPRRKREPFVVVQQLAQVGIGCSITNCGGPCVQRGLLVA